MNNKQQRYLAYAQRLAARSNYKIQVGAVIVHNGTPIATGYNYIKSHPKWVTPKCATLHAEIAAWLTCGRTNLRGATIYVYRAHKDGTPALARPCANCQAVLREAGVKWMVYSTANWPFYLKEAL